MAFALTTYIYPIEKAIKFSKFFGYKFDNPRNDTEVALIKEFITNSNYLSPDPEYNQGSAIASAYNYFRKYLKKEDSYAYDFFDKQKAVSVIDLIAASWIIIRYDDDKQFEKVIVNKNEMFELTWNSGNGKKAFVKNFDMLRDYCSLISLLVQNESFYGGESFMFTENPAQIFGRIENRKIYDLFEDYRHQCFSPQKSGVAFPLWKFFPTAIKELKKVTRRADKLFAINQLAKTGHKVPLSQRQNPNQKLLFIGGLLKTIHATHAIKVKLILLVSIIEFMLTRNPDFNRFNVEDSISKQFKLKASILIYQNNTKRNLETVKKNLTNFYSQRSTIAHGSHIDKKDESEFIQSVSILYEYIRAVMSQYIKNQNLVDFLKDN